MAIGRRVSFGVFVPMAMLAVAALLWTLVWYSAATRTRVALADWRAEFATQGGELICAHEDSGGYPFRLEFRCTDPVVRISTGAVGYVVTAKKLIAVAQAYDTQHMIFEINAPFRLERGSTGMQPLASAESGVVRTSLEFEDGRASRLSTVFPAWRAVLDGVGAAGPAGGIAQVIGAQSSELHIRARPGEDAIDIAISAVDAYFPDPVPGELDNAERVNVERINLVTVINKPQTIRLSNLDTWLGRWRDGGGVADVRRLSFDSKHLSGEGAGAVNLTPEGQLEGALKVRLTKLDQFAEVLETRGIISDSDGELLRGAVGLFSKSINGQKSVTLSVRIRDGQVYLGPVKVVTLPALM